MQTTVLYMRITLELGSCTHMMICIIIKQMIICIMMKHKMICILIMLLYLNLHMGTFRVKIKEELKLSNMYAYVNLLHYIRRINCFNCINLRFHNTKHFLLVCDVDSCKVQFNYNSREMITIFVCCEPPNPKAIQWGGLL